MADFSNDFNNLVIVIMIFSHDFYAFKKTFPIC